ncbi:MAG: GGDEF domain-containing protein, partial [Vallitaleaceae bacterium]|nr:GGDEF domain-containing protein [Vallitaleaceae bacterium]
YAYYSTQLWIAARYLQAITLLVAFLFIKYKRKLHDYVIFNIYLGISILILLSIFVWDIFPECYIEFAGLTFFKIISEYVISLILIVALLVLYLFRRFLDHKQLLYLGASVIITIFSELTFTYYVSLFGFFLFLGHIFKVIAFYFIYRAVVVKSIHEPYDIIFKELKEQELDLNDQNEKLVEIANRDHLSGLFNRKHIVDRIEHEITLYGVTEAMFTIAIIDIDNFKLINDRFGHMYGDDVIKIVGAIINEEIRQEDTLGRFGGDEFIILMKDTDEQQGARLLSRIQNKLARIHMKESITISVGIGSYTGKSLEDFIHDVDMNLYQAKTLGKNRIITNAHLKI